jgi:XRE family transcriptional regulator, fatty acid utilization regulator
MEWRMDSTFKRKIMAGGRVRKLRSELALSQSAMAQELGISVSYLNLVERNQRPLTAQLLIRLSENYTIDMRSFGEEDEASAARQLDEVFADPVFESTKVTPNDVRVVAEQAPSLIPAIRQLYAAYADARELASKGGGVEIERGELKGISRSSEILDKTRAFLQQNQNHFPALEELAEDLHQQLTAQGEQLHAAILARLHKKHGIRVQVMTVAEIGTTLRHYDRHRRKLMISERLALPGRIFQAANQLGLAECHEAIEAECQKLKADMPHADRFGFMTLANYFSGALLMPYTLFHVAAEELRYDVEALASRFSVSFEQCAHRLTTLARPSARGVPFFMVRVDAAGNISKRFSSGTFPFARVGGTCPRWNLHSTFRNPGRIQTQVVEIEGKTWLSLARTVKRVTTPWGEPEALFSVGLGCEARFADRLIYFHQLNLKQAMPTQIGVNCRLCERPNCHERSAPSIVDKMQFNENTRGLSPFSI